MKKLDKISDELELIESEKASGALAQLVTSKNYRASENEEKKTEQKNKLNKVSEKQLKKQVKMWWL